jgi:hypothetical protein
MSEREYERKRMLMHPTWVNDGVIRRKCRQLLRQWAKSGPEFGRYSKYQYCRYIRELRDRTGGIEG